MPSSTSVQAGPDFTKLERRLALSLAAHAEQQPAPVSTTDERSTPEQIPPERLRLASANIRYLSAIIGQLVELRNQPERDEYGTLRPSKHAFETACNLLTDAAIVSALIGREIPHGCASTDSQGGVRIEWVRPTSSAHLVVPALADHVGYVYHEIGDDYGTVAATPETLASWLREIV